MEAGRAEQRPPKQVLQRGPRSHQPSGSAFQMGEGDGRKATELRSSLPLPRLLNTHPGRHGSSTPPSFERYVHSRTDVTKLSAKLQPS